jgi:hypothetical protein
MELEHILAIVNIFANATIGISLAAFYILLYGNHDSIVHKWPIVQHWSIKIGLVTAAVCSIWNAMNVIVRKIMPRDPGSDIIDFTVVPTGEIIMNVGLAIIFAWAVYFHKYHFLEAMAKVKKTVRTKTVPKAKAKTTNGRSKLPPRSRN